MKNIKLIIGIILGMIITSGITAYATLKYSATEIEYTNEKNVSQALNELYDMKKNYILPSGTKTITEKGSQIDVSKYQFADTTGLYTETEATTGAGKYWKKDSLSITQPNMSIDVGFQPSHVFVFGNMGTEIFEIHINNNGNKRFGHTSVDNSYDDNSSWAGISNNGFWISGWKTGYTYSYIAVK